MPSTAFTLDDVARRVGMNRTYFCLFFKRIIGKTFVTYLNECRIEFACQLLKQQSGTVAEICYQAGLPSTNKALSIK